MNDISNWPVSSAFVVAIFVPEVGLKSQPGTASLYASVKACTGGNRSEGTPPCTIATVGVKNSVLNKIIQSDNTHTDEPIEILFLFIGEDAVAVVDDDAEVDADEGSDWNLLLFVIVVDVVAMPTIDFLIYLFELSITMQCRKRMWAVASNIIIIILFMLPRLVLSFPLHNLIVVYYS